MGVGEKARQTSIAGPVGFCQDIWCLTLTLTAWMGAPPSLSQLYCAPLSAPAQEDSSLLESFASLNMCYLNSTLTQLSLQLCDLSPSSNQKLPASILGFIAQSSTLAWKTSQASRHKGPFSMEETCPLQVTAKEKQEQGCQALLICCLGLFTSPSSTHIISDTPL